MRYVKQPSQSFSHRQASVRMDSLPRSETNITFRVLRSGGMFKPSSVCCFPTFHSSRRFSTVFQVFNRINANNHNFFAPATLTTRDVEILQQFFSRRTSFDDPFCCRLSSVLTKTRIFNTSLSSSSPLEFFFFLFIKKHNSKFECSNFASKSKLFAKRY